MKQLTCEMCGSTDLMKQEGVFICQTCGMKYSIEDAKKMMIEGTVDVQGTVKVDNSPFVEKYLVNARRALQKEDWEEVEKYYNMVEQNAPNNIEAIFFSAYGKAMSCLVECTSYNTAVTKFNVLNKSISVINDYYELTNEDKEFVLRKISDAIAKMIKSRHLAIMDKLMHTTKDAFIIELKQIAEKHSEEYIQELISEMSALKKAGCYVATCVYGSYDCPQVWTLRRYRDDTLGATWYGRLFIRTYYAISPTLVKWFGNTNWFKKLWKGKLDRMVAKLQSNGVEDTPYEDKSW